MMEVGKWRAKILNRYMYMWYEPCAGYELLYPGPDLLNVMVTQPSGSGTI